MPEVLWRSGRSFLQCHPNAHILQTGEWGELKSGFGWDAVRFVSGDVGTQILFRKLPLGFTIAYMPKPVISDQLSVISKQSPVFSEEFWKEVDWFVKNIAPYFSKSNPMLWDDPNFSVSSVVFHLFPTQHPTSSNNNCGHPGNRRRNPGAHETEDALQHSAGREKRSHRPRLGRYPCVPQDDAGHGRAR